MPKKCNKDGCSNNVFGSGFCKSHQYLRDKVKKKEPTDRGLFKRDSEVVVVKFDELNKWFEDGMLKHRVCENCGKSLAGLSDKDWRGSQHHVLFKEHFKSVQSNPINRLILGRWCCHPIVHTSHENASKMLIFQKAKKIVFSLLPELTKEELRRIPKIYNIL